jgi:arylsulfatase A-like enzyme
VHAAETTADITTNAALARLKGHARRPFFVWVHYFDAHGSVDPRPPYDTMYSPGYRGRIKSGMEWRTRIACDGYEPTQNDLKRILALYDGAITYQDDQLGRLLQWLREEKLYEESLIIVIGDHGEEFYEHDPVIAQASQLWESTLPVPLIVKLPGNEFAGREVQAPVESVDIVPTVLDYLGAIDHELPGQSLLKWVKRDDPNSDRIIVSETFAPEGGRDASALLKGSRKIIFDAETRECRHYDLASDPREKTDLYGSRQREARKLEYDLGAWQRRVQTAPRQNTPLSEDEKRKLRSLGYTH